MKKTRLWEVKSSDVRRVKSVIFHSSLFIFHFLLSFSLSAQYLQIKETDQAGREYTVSGARQAVDINSKLTIVVNKEAIRNTTDQSMRLLGESRVDSILEALTLYKAMIEELENTMRQYQQVISNPARTLDELSDALGVRADIGLRVLELFPEDSRYYVRLEEELELVEDGSTNDQFRAMVRVLAEEIGYGEAQLNILRKEAGYFFQLGAWSVTGAGPVQVHLEGFDTLAQGEFFEYQRNKFYLTEEQLRTLQGLVSFFESRESTTLFDRFVGMIPGFLSKAVDIAAITRHVNDLRTSIAGLEAEAAGLKEDLLQRIHSIEDNKLQLVELTGKLIMKYSQPGGISGAGSGLGVLFGFNQDVQALRSQAELILGDLSGLAEKVSSISVPAAVKDIRNTLVSAEGLLKQSVTAITEFISESYHVAVYGRRINTAALELSEKMLKLDIDQIPTSATLDLLYTGKREPGDKVIFKALVWNGAGSTPFASETLEYPVMNALPHVHMSVVYTFARPVAQHTRFKGGPLVSLLYKFKSRSLAYRNFLDPGIGLHAASYDFNNDDTPEFAGGIVLSMFNDYLQGGWGFNFNADTGYWFVGLRIPIPNSPVSLMGQ